MKEDQAEVVEPPLPPWDPRGPQPADPGAPGENVNCCNECDQKMLMIKTMMILRLMMFVVQGAGVNLKAEKEDPEKKKLIDKGWKDNAYNQ